MNTNTLMEPAPAANAKLRLFTLYADFPAGMRARRLMNRITALAGRLGRGRRDGNWTPWRRSDHSRLDRQEASESDVLLIATSAVEADPATSMARIAGGLSVARPRLLLGLLGDERRWTKPIGWWRTR
jgi:hypothetical protein